MSELAEKKALEAYPQCMLYDNVTQKFDDINGCYRVGFEVGYDKALSEYNRWIPVTESLPPIEQEVIVISNQLHGKELGHTGYISYGHVVNKEGCLSRDIITGEISEYIPQDYNGWNIPGVTHWMPCPEIP